jgi:small subunit ribosomal protein S8
MTDPIADMLTRIRNAQMAKKSQVVLPWSKIKQAISEILVKEGFLTSTEKISDKFPELKLTLKYDNGKPFVRSLQRISKPGCRVYVRKDELPNVLGGQGIAIISTSRGLFTNKEAKTSGLGGEVVCEIY